MKDKYLTRELDFQTLCLKRTRNNPSLVVDHCMFARVVPHLSGTLFYKPYRAAIEPLHCAQDKSYRQNYQEQ